MRASRNQVNDCKIFYNDLDYVLEVDTFVSQELVVEVVLDFVHVGSDIDMFEERFWEVAAG